MKIGNLATDQAVVPHQVIIPIPQASLKHEAAFGPDGFIGGCPQEIVDGPDAVFLSCVDDLKLTNERSTRRKYCCDLALSGRGSKGCEQAREIVLLHKAYKAGFEGVAIDQGRLAIPD
jgi:hypothetical protein